jgi:hypothetical protein
MTKMMIVINKERKAAVSAVNWSAEKIPDSTIEHVNNDDMNFLDIKNPQKKMDFHFFPLRKTLT